MTTRFLRLALLLLTLSGVPAAHAQFAVIDVASLTQLISQLQALEQELATARGQLTQEQAEFESMTGSHGMQQLLGGTVRNYLPSDCSAVQGALQGSAGFAQLSAEVHAARTADAGLSDA